MPAPTYSSRDYEITYVPDGCDTYTVEDIITVLVPNPPPPEIIIDDRAPCNGVKGKLIV